MLLKLVGLRNILRIIPVLRVKKREKFMLLGISKDCEKLNHPNRKLRVHKFHKEEIFHVLCRYTVYFLKGIKTKTYLVPTRFCTVDLMLVSIHPYGNSPKRNRSE